MADFLSRLIEDNQLSRKIELAIINTANAEGDLDQATPEAGVHFKEV